MNISIARNSILGIICCGLLIACDGGGRVTGVDGRTITNNDNGQQARNETGVFDGPEALDLLTDHQHWMGAWSSPSAPHPGPVAAEQSFRLVVSPSISGAAIRVRLSNSFGQVPVTFGEVRVAKSAGGMAVDPATDTRVTFDGQPSVKLPAYADRVSDPIPFPVKYGEQVAVSVYVSGVSGLMRGVPVLGVGCDVGTSPPGTGDATADAGGGSYLPSVGCVLLSGLDVYDPEALGTVVTLGDSITAGSSADPGQGWAWKLAERINAAGLKLGVVNVGIGGNAATDQGNNPATIGIAGVNGSPVAPFGQPGVLRFDRDVLRQTNVRTVIIYLAGNDLRYNAPVDEVIAANQDMVDRAHAAGIRVILATYTPATVVNSICVFANLAGADCPVDPAAIDRNDDRRRFNDWVLSHPTIDGVVDFDLAAGDPDDPDRLRAEYDSGDNVHPNNAGHAALADAVPLDLL